MKHRSRTVFLFCLIFVSLFAFVSCGEVDPDPDTEDVYYTVRFDVLGTVTTVQVKEGDTPTFEGTPAKPSDGTTSYVFSGWDKAIVPAAADVTYTAQFTPCPAETLTVKWFTEGEILSTTVLKGEIPVEPDFAKTVETASFTKTFTGWDKPLAPVTENNTAYRAQYTTVYKTVTVTFKNGETVLDEKQVKIGDVPVFDGATPVKEGLTFFGFTNTSSGVTEPVTCQAQFCKLDPAQLKTAIKDFAPIKFGSTKDGENTGNANNSGSALLYLAMDAYLSGEENDISARCLEHLRSLITGGQEPAFTAGPFWAYAYISGGITMCKKTPVIWNALTTEEKDKLDLIMSCFAISSAFVTDDDNYYKTGPALTGNFYKTWNPNHRMANIEPIIYASLYFGGADAVNNILLGFDYDTYIAKFDQYGFVNVKHNWSMEGFLLSDGTMAPGSKELMMNGGTAYYKFDVSQTGNKKGEAAGNGVGVKTAYTYNKYTLDQLDKIYEALLNNNYNGGKVFSKYMKDGQAICYILGDLTSPMEGEVGMMYEFASSDGDGIRSSASYCLEDFVLAFSCGQVLKALGAYVPENHSVIFRKTFVGNTDFIFKIDNGYHGYSRGSAYDTKAKNDICYFGWRSFWLSEYGDLTLDDFAPVSRDLNFEDNLPEISTNGFNASAGDEHADVKTSDHAHSGQSVLKIRVQETWGRMRLVGYFSSEDIGKTYDISFWYYMETALEGDGPFNFTVKVDTKDCQQAGGYAAYTVPVTKSGEWVNVKYNVTYTKEMNDAGANCLVFYFPHIGQIHGQRDPNDSNKYILDNGEYIGARFAEILLDDFTITESAATDLPAKIFELNYDNFTTLPPSDGGIGGYGKSTQSFSLGGTSGENRYFAVTIQDTTKDMGYQFFAKTESLYPGAYVKSVEDSSGSSVKVVDSMKYTFDFKATSPDADSAPNMTFTMYNQNNGSGLKLINFSATQAKSRGGQVLCDLTPGTFKRYTVTVDMTDTSNIALNYYVDGEFVLAETVTNDSYAQAFLGMMQFKFYIGTNSTVGKTVWIDDIVLYRDIVAPVTEE